MRPPLQQIEAVFHEALVIPAPDRGAFLDRACAGNPDLLQEVQSLLRHAAGQTETFAAAVKPVVRDLLEGSAAAMEIEAGAMLGPFRLEHKLGEGGMGFVYLATDTRLGRKVAVKVIRQTLARTAEARARFLREARSAAALSHPNIATLLDVGETGARLWLVMEYVDGVPLRARLAGTLAESLCLRYATQIAAALEHAHARRIIHRDIKPENILITGEENVKMIDFGLARTVYERSDSATPITAPDAFIGTLAYAAPEILTGASGSARSDIYSFGVLLYEMTCGEQPFARLSGHALVSAIMTGSYPRCSSLNAGTSSRMAAVIDRCMSREPAARFKDARDLSTALLGWGSDIKLPAETAGPTLAIMDFRNIGGAANLEWLGAGIAETLSADLAKLKSVRIASRGRVVQSLRRLGNSSDDPGTAIELGRSLGARWVVTGGYQQVGERIRVTATLIDSSTGDSLLAEKIDGRWDELFEVQDHVVEVLLKALSIGFGTTDQQKIMPAETRNLAAYEHYVRGRQQLYVMDAKSLSGAIRDLEQAVSFDPDYAFAYSALGTAHALQFIRTSDPADITCASNYLERAIQLDPELGEPYPWLNNVRLRKNDPVGALAAGRKAVELQPDLAEAHYFYGATHYMIPEFQPGALRRKASHLVEAIRLQPKLHSAWLLLGASAAYLGKHQDAIHILREAVRMESDPDVVYRFVGARTLQAIAQTRACSWDAARAMHLEALETLRETDHIYTTCFQTLSTSGLGDIELRCGNHGAALTHYRRARRFITESRRITGSTRLLIRVNAGLAAAYAAAGEMERAEELASEAATQLQSLAGQTATVTFECSLAQLWLCIAVTEVRLGRIEAAAESLTHAHESGWLDGRWLSTDPELSSLHGHSAYVSFLEELASAPETEIAIPAITAAQRPEHQSASGGT